ncbi:hypothetical protein BJX70DRAFT_407095 [Aspergillus crustosus]
MPSQERIRRPDVVWTGVTDPALHKRLQNIIHQRALRVRKSDQQRSLIAQQQARKERARAGVRCYATILPRPNPVPQGPRKRLLPQPIMLLKAVAMMTSFNGAAYERYYAADIYLDQLLTLAKFNVLRAFVDNMAALGWSMQAMEDDDALSLYSYPDSNTTRKGNHHHHHRHHHHEGKKGGISVPASLLLTTTQHSIPHYSWLDCFPGFDHCKLYTDRMDPANGDIGIMVWGDPWLPQSWEVSEMFVRKWSWVIKGCSELLVSSKYWRARRSLKRLAVSSL